MEDQLLAEIVRDGLLGQIVVGGPQAAGGDDGVHPGKGQDQTLFQPLGVVAHYGLVVQIDSQSRHLLGDVGGVGVDDVAHEQLRADAENLRRMGFVAHILKTFRRIFLYCSTIPGK